MATCEKCGMETQSAAYHVCKTMSEERAREIAREEIRATSGVQQMQDVLAEAIKLKTRDATLEEAAKLIESHGYATTFADAAKRIRSLKSTTIRDLSGNERHLVEQPAPAQPCSTCGATSRENPRGQFCSNGYHAPRVHELQSEIASLKTERDEAIASIPQMIREERARGEKERDDLRLKLAAAESRIANMATQEKWLTEKAVELQNQLAMARTIYGPDQELHRKLAAAEKALDEIARALEYDYGHSAAEGFWEAREIMKRTGRLGGGEKKP